MSDSNQILIQSVPPSAAARPATTVFDALRREIDRVFESFHVGHLRASFAPRPFDVTTPFGGDEWGPVPAIDARATAAGFRLTAELPGVDGTDIRVSVSDDTLTIRGEKRESIEDKGHGGLLLERRYGAFVRSFQLPHSVDTTRIEATFDKGVLAVTLPRSEASKGSETTIEVKAA